MLRRLLVCWLILSVQGYGLALAADLHGVQSLEQICTQDAGTPDHAAHTGSDADHCDHGGVHLLGLPAASLRMNLPLVTGPHGDAALPLPVPPARRTLRPPILLS